MSEQRRSKDSSAWKKVAALFKAIDDGDVGQVGECLLTVPSPDVQSDDGLTPLKYAVMMKKAQIVGALLESGACPNTTDNWESLHWAVREQHHEIIQLLLNAKANPDTRDTDYAGATPLTRAAHCHDNRTMKMLLDAGCDVNLPGIMSNPALHIALNLYPSDCHDTVSLLLEHGADPTLENQLGYNAISVAAKKSSLPTSVFEQLFDIAQTKWTCESEKRAQIGSAISRAIQSGNTDRVRWLFQHFNQSEYTPQSFSLINSFLIDVCTSSDDVSLVKLFLTKVPLFSIVNGIVLSTAVQMDRQQIILELLHCGVDPNLQVNNGFSVSTPLVFAIDKGHSKLAMGFIQAGGDVNRGIREQDIYMPITTILGQAQVTRIRYMATAPINLALTLNKEETATALYLGGCHLDHLRTDLQTGALVCNNTLHDWLTHRLSHPMRLKDACRVAVRGSLQHPLLTNVEQLPLPPVIKDFLMFHDLPNCLL